MPSQHSVVSASKHPRIRKASGPKVLCALRGHIFMVSQHNTTRPVHTTSDGECVTEWMQNTKHACQSDPASSLVPSPLRVIMITVHVHPDTMLLRCLEQQRWVPCATDRTPFQQTVARNLVSRRALLNIQGLDSPACLDSLAQGNHDKAPVSVHESLPSCL